jgi:glucose/mannose-6-phosphate isomerase
MNDNLDSLGIKDALELFPDQIRSAYKQASAATITLKAEDFSALVISGMGGSSNAAKIIQGVYESDLKLPITVFNDYGLPGWVNEKTLVIANSYSGNTEETLSAVEKAKQMGAKVIGISTGGKINDVVINPGPTNPSGFPKSGLGVSLGALLGVLNKIGLIDLSVDKLESSLTELVKIRSNWKVEDTAKWLNGGIPVLFCGRPLIGALNAGRNALCEISRNFTQFYDFPEVNHVLIEATQKPEVAKMNKYIFFESSLLHPRIMTRYEITKKIFDEQGLTYTGIALEGTDAFTQSLELAHFCSWVGYHLSIAQNTDPGPEPWILKLKELLSQPVH